MNNESIMSFEHTNTLEELKKAFYESRSNFVSSFLEEDDDFDDETDNF